MMKGIVFDNKGNAVRKFGGQFTKAIHLEDNPTKVLWRPNPMPQNHEEYYGFTYFAMKLNELDGKLAERIPPTDSRLRPDLRHLENGNLTKAQEYKEKLEELQRQRGKERLEKGESYEPRWFRRNPRDATNLSYIFTGEYWKKRSNPGFRNMTFVDLWPREDD